MDAIFAVTAVRPQAGRPAGQPPPGHPAGPGQRSAGRRRGFTLIEMLTVVVIIGILASLITGAVIAAKRKARITIIAIEINQLEAALKAYKQKYGEYPPDFAGLRGTPAQRAQAQRAVLRHLRKAYPRFNLRRRNNDLEWEWTRLKIRAARYKLDLDSLDPSTALAFWLGGLPDRMGSSKLIGFSANPEDPFDLGDAGNRGSRQPALFEFDQRRLVEAAKDANGSSGGAGAFWYYPNTGSGGKAPYLYFRPTNGSYEGKAWKHLLPGGTTETVRPYVETNVDPENQGLLVRGWVKPRSFQIISASLDVAYGEGNSYPTGAAAPGSPPLPPAWGYSDGNFDNITNFSEGGTLEGKM